MSVRLSDGLRAAILSDYGLTAMMNYGTIRVFSGQQPLNASLQPTGTLLANITKQGQTFQPGTYNGALEVGLVPTGGLGLVGEWRMKGVTTGVAGWWRWTWNAPDTDEDSQYYPRMDGLVGESLILATADITVATNVVITEFNVNIME